MTSLWTILIPAISVLLASKSPPPALGMFLCSQIITNLNTTIFFISTTHPLCCSDVSHGKQSAETIRSYFSFANHLMLRWCHCRWLQPGSVLKTEYPSNGDITWLGLSCVSPRPLISILFFSFGLPLCLICLIPLEVVWKQHTHSPYLQPFSNISFVDLINPSVVYKKLDTKS